MDTNILLADHHVIFREALRALIEKRDDLQVVGEASDGEEAVRLAELLKPELIVMEISMPRLSGLEVTRRLVASGCRANILILSMHEGRTYVEEALRAGAAGYLLKTGSADEFLRAIDAVRAGRSYLSPDVAQHVVDAITRVRDPMQSGSGFLTHRERQVLQLVAEGLSSKEIAADLGVSTKTVDSHRCKLMEKLGIHKVSGLVRYAIREGLVTV